MIRVVTKPWSIRLADGRQAYARRGWDNPRSPWFSQRLCMAAALGVDRADWLLDRVQGELRVEIAAKSVDTSPQMKRITDAGVEAPTS
jgi:hypothetical protein